MPSLGADMEEGRITEWLVHPGDAVERGQIVVIVETEKSDIEVEVFDPGTVVELLVGEGELVPVGTPIARIGPAGATVAAAPASAPMPAPTEPSREPEPAVPEPVTRRSAAPATAHVTSPVIRHLADDLHVDATRVRTSDGRVHRDDVVRAWQAATRPRVTPRARRLMAERGLAPDTFGDRPLTTGDDVLAFESPVPAPATAAKPSKAETMRQRIAALMTRSWEEIPHYHVAKRIDLSAATTRLTAANEARPLAERVLPGAVLLCATARAARAVPGCNGWWRDGHLVESDEVRLGVVLSLRGGGLVVPTIDRADELTPVAMMVRLGELVQRARQGRLRGSDVGEASITVTNLGDLGADSVLGVIHPPQVAIVGFGTVHDEVWPVDGVPTVRATVHATLAGDHRATDGLTGARFLTRLDSLLNGPLLEEI
jgi:pyruvate dehydrogenase E2 component (dihydrolipoamide acetyltransferase)